MKRNCSAAYSPSRDGRRESFNGDERLDFGREMGCSMCELLRPATLNAVAMQDRNFRKRTGCEWSTSSWSRANRKRSIAASYRESRTFGNARIADFTELRILDMLT